MTAEAEQNGAEGADESRTEENEDEARSAREKVSEGIKEGIGVLAAFKDALEETIQEARDRGDLSAEKAKEVMKDALGKAQSAAGDAKDKLDFVSQKDFEGLQTAVDAIKDRVSALESHFRGETDDEDPAEPETGSDSTKSAEGGDVHG